MYLFEAETAADELRRENRKFIPNNDINLASLEIKHYSYTIPGPIFAGPAKCDSRDMGCLVLAFIRTR